MALVGLIRLGLTAPGPLLRYFLKGDLGAGFWLRDQLLPGPAGPLVPVARAPLFGENRVAELSEPVTIILPVFNAFEVLDLCLARLGAHTAPMHPVILIDDASTDPRVRPRLRAFEAAREGVTLLMQERNLGFVQSVNRALAARKTSHAVLLNSDALVPPRWLPRLMRPILLDVRVASVTPMSNEAEILSVPIASDPDGASADTLARLDQTASQIAPGSAEVEIPTGIGFCMALNGRFLAEVGGLDPAFGRGYGEEVDWCRRAIAAGGRHVGTAALFVEHRGGQSFGQAEKIRRIAQNNALISRRYPDFDAEVAQFKSEDPLVGPRLALALSALDPQVPLRVYLAHGLGGGAEHWLQARLAADVAARGAAVVLRQTAEGSLFALVTAAGETQARFSVGENFSRLLAQAPAIELVYSCMVGAPDPLALIVPLVAGLRPKRDRFELLFHDYFPLCPSYNLIGSDGRYCGLPAEADCARCYQRLVTGPATRPARLADWRAAWAALMGRADAQVVFSEASRALVARAFPAQAAKIVLRPHRVTWLPGLLSQGAGPLVIGVLGDIGMPKGAEVLHALARLLPDHVRLVVIGKLDPAYHHPRITVHGPYARDEIGELARRYGVTSWLMPSIWPETFSFTTHEVLATGLPVSGFDLGAQGAALSQAPNGYLLGAPDQPLRSVLDQLLANDGIGITTTRETHSAAGGAAFHPAMR